MSKIKTKGLREDFKIILMAVLLAGAIILTYYFHAVIGVGTVFTHLFYLPIILASIWWKKKGVLVAVFLAVMLILSHHFLRADVLVLNDYLRSLMFVIISSVVALLSSQIAKMEKLLRETRDYLENLIDYANAPIIVWDPQFKITRFNHAFEKLTGRNVDEVLGSQIDILFPSEQRDKSMELIRQTITGERWETVEIPIIHVDGSVRILLWNSATIFDPDGKTAIATIAQGLDITERKQAEEALRETRDYLENLIDYANAPIIVWDPQFKITRFNHAFEKLTGRNVDEVLGSQIDILFPSEQRDKSMELIRQTITGERWETVEIPIIHVDGSVRILLWNSATIFDPDGKTAIATIAQGLDITERKQAEEQLQLLSSIAKQTSEGIALVDLEGNLQFINNAFAQMHGYTPEELLGKNLSIFHTPEQMPSVKATNMQIEETGGFSGEIWHVRRDGTVFPTIMNNSLFHNEKGRAVGMIGVVRDITIRRKAENELRKSEKRFRDITENALEWVWEVDKDGKYTYASSVVEKVLGYKPDEILGKHFYDLFHPEGREEYKKAAFDAFAKKQTFVEFINRNVHKNGKIVWLSTSGLPILDEDGNLLGYRGADTDITQRKMAEEELRASEERYRAIWENSPAGICLTDRDGVYCYVNPAYCKTYGYTKEQLIGRQFYEMIVRPEDKEEHRKSYTERFDMGESVPMGEVEFIKSDGEPVWIQFTGDFIRNKGVYKYLVSMNVNITERKMAEEALAAESERLAVTLRSIGDGVITCDTKGNVILLNKVAENLTGWSEKEAKGKQVSQVFNIINEETRHLCENPIDKVLEKGVIVGLANHTVLISKDGTERFIADSGAPIGTKDGKVIGVVLVFRDVTENRKMQEFVSRAQRLETAGRIAGQVAHDFNNLLGPLVAYPDFIRESLPEDHQSISYLDDMEKSAEQIANINQQLLTLGRRGHYNQEPLSLNQIVLQVINQIYPIPDTLVIETDLHKNLLNIKGGASQIYRVIANFISNACDAMQNIGQLTIKTENYYADITSGQFGCIPRGEYVKLTISDTGCGISKDIKPRIFDPFFTTKTTDKKKGSGLGLSVAHAVVEDHNGYIDLTSTVGKGATFYTYFPITRDAIDTDVTDEIIGGTESVLVIDDDQVQQDVTIKLLLKLGYQANAVNSGKKAIEFLKENSQDLLILDMVMPEGIDGTETYQKALEINPSQKAIIVSGFAESERVEEALRLGAGTFVKKPLTLKTIAPAVRKELDRKVK